MDIPSAKHIDYTNAYEICGYQMLLCEIFERAGGFGVGMSSGKDMIMVRREGLIWLQNVKDAINMALDTPNNSENPTTELTLGDIPRLLASYDFYYRVCHCEPCFTFVRDITLKVADRWVRGNKSITKERVALMLHKEISWDIRSIPKRYVDFAMSMLGSWVKELDSFGRLQNISPEDAYAIVSFLLWQDLFAFGIKDTDKRRWIVTYTLTDNEIDKLDADTLWAYTDFDQRSSSFLCKSVEEQEERYSRLISRLASFPNTDVFTREAIELYLANSITA